MPNLEENIKSSRNIKDTSLKTYLLTLKKIKYKLGYDPNDELKNSKFLYDYKNVMKIINDTDKLTSKKNKLTAILVALQSEEKKNEELIEKYSHELKKLSEQYITFLKKQEKTETQKENWISYKELIKISEQLAKEVGITDINKRGDGSETITNKNFDKLQQYIILSTYLHFPIRNDFAEMKILKLSEYNKLDEKIKSNNNYLILLPRNQKAFYINAFKNSNKMSAKIFKIPRKLNALIKMWLKYNKSGFYLVKKNRKDPMNANNITKFLNRLFKKYTNKKISTSMMRHIIISHDLENTKTIKEKEEEEENIENKYMHSGSINQLYRKIED